VFFNRKLHKCNIHSIGFEEIDRNVLNEEHKKQYDDGRIYLSIVEIPKQHGDRVINEVSIVMHKKIVIDSGKPKLTLTQNLNKGSYKLR